MRTKTSLFAIIGVMSVVGATSAFGAATVRTLGGAGTYTGVSSAVAAKNSGTTSGTTTTRSRAGTIRVTPSVGTVSSGTKTTTTKTVTPTTVTTTGTNTSSGNGGADTRMSIGKYLNGSSLTTLGKTSTTSGVSDAEVRGLISDVEELQNKVAGHDTDITNLEGVVDGYDTDITGLEGSVSGLQDTIGDGESGLTKDVADLQDTIGDEDTGGLLKRVKDLEDASATDLSGYATQTWVNTQGFLTESDITEAVSAKQNALTTSKTVAITTDAQSGQTTADLVAPDCSGDGPCILSYADGALTKAAVATNWGE